MRTMRWAVALATTTAVTAGSWSQASAAWAPATTAVQYWGNVSVGNHVAARTPFLAYGGTNYFGIWYLMQLLDKHGMQATWAHKSLTVNWMPANRAATTVSVDGAVVSGAHTLSIAGSTYVDVTRIAPKLGWSLSYDAKNQSLTVHQTANPMRHATSTANHGITRAHRNAQAAWMNGGAGNKTVQVTQTWAPFTGWRTVPVLQSAGTNFFGVWYMTQWLEQYGYNSEWLNHTVNVDALPQVETGAMMIFGSNQDPTALVQWNGDWYAPMTTLMGIANLSAGVDLSGNSYITLLADTHNVGPTDVASGGTGQFDITGSLNGVSGPGAQVAMQDAANHVTVVPADAQTGQFHATLTGTSASLIGVYTPALGWVGQAATVSSVNSAITVSPVPATAQLTGLVAVTGTNESVSNGQIVLRSDLTHAHYVTRMDSNGKYSLSVPVGPYEVWTAAINGTPIFLGKRFLAGAGSGTIPTVTIPALPTNGTVVSKNAAVVAEGTDVSPMQLISIDNMFERVFAYDIAQTGLTAQVPVIIQVFENTPEYTQHFLDEGYTLSDSSSFGDNSQAASEGPQLISMNMQGLTNEFGVDVMAHEFTHSLISTVSQNLPSWVNEGVAWHQGIGAETDLSPDATLFSALQWNQWQDIVRHQHLGDLYALGSANALDPRYNVESQDYFAVEMLIDQFGLAKVIQYVTQVDQTGDATTFQQVFGEAESSFTLQVSQRLAQLAAQSDKGFSVTLRILPGGPSQLVLSSPKGKTWWFDGATPGTYTFVCLPNGTVTGPSNLTASAPVNNSGDGTWDIGAQEGSNQAFYSLDTSFGLDYLEATTVFLNNSSTGQNGLSTELPIGVDLVSLTPNP